MYIGFSKAIDFHQTSRFPLKTHPNMMQHAGIRVERNLISVHGVFSNHQAAVAELLAC